MNGAHWHLVVNHLPIIFPIVGVIVMLMGLIAKSEAVKRAALGVFVLGAFAALAAMSTGEGAEEVVEKISGVTENYIETHEESAETFAILSYVLGGISLIGLWASFKEKSFSSLLSIGSLLFALVLLFFGRQTGTTGGEIRHTEIRSASSMPATDYPGKENKGKDDDD